MKALKVISVIVIILVAALIGGAVWLNHYVQSPAFRDSVLASAKQSLGSEVAIQDLQVSLLHGASLRGIRLANPPGYDGDLLKADAFVLRYRLAPLLQKRVEIEKLSIEKPVITLIRNEKEEWNYDKLGAAKTATPAAPSTGRSASAPLDVTLSSLALEHGDVTMLSGGKPLLKMQDINLQSSASLAGNRLSGQGKTSVANINVADALFVKQLAAPVMIGSDAVKLAPLTGSCAGGAISGEAGVALTPVFKYSADIQLKDSDMVTLLQEAGVKKKVIEGKLQLTCKLEGTGGLPTMAGNGKAEISGGRLIQIPTLNLLGALLQIPLLQDLKFDQCLLEFTIADNRMQTPVIKITSSQVHITGHGTVSLEDYSLDHRLTLALAGGLLDKVPKEARGIFKDRGDGFLTLEVHVYGPYDSPKTDLKELLLKGAKDQLLQEGLKKLFK